MRSIETTVRGLRWARVRHFLLAVLLAVMGVLAFRVSQHLPARDVWASVGGWSAILAFGAAWYHLREFRGKGRRYRQQRQRAANELLRADFKWRW